MRWHRHSKCDRAEIVVREPWHDTRVGWATRHWKRRALWAIHSASATGSPSRRPSTSTVAARARRRRVDEEPHPRGGDYVPGCRILNGLATPSSSPRLASSMPLQASFSSPSSRTSRLGADEVAGRRSVHPHRQAQHPRRWVNSAVISPHRGQRWPRIDSTLLAPIVRPRIGRRLSGEPWSQGGKESCL